MIKPSDKKIIVSTLGSNYSGEIITHLDKKQIFNSNGNSFSPDHVRMIVCGMKTNEKVEQAIINYVVSKKAKKLRSQQRLAAKLRK